MSPPRTKKTTKSTIRNALNSVTTYGYDGAGRRNLVTNALGDITTTVFDANGNVESVTNALGQHVTYLYDATNKRATMQLLLNGQSVANFSLNAQPGNNQTLVFKRFGTGNLAGMISSNEFGNYTNQHHPEEATIGWKYSNFHLDMTPK